MGFRARYWEFDHTFGGGLSAGGVLVPGAEAFHNWDTWVADLEVTDSTRLGCYWDVTYSCGYRHVEYDERRGAAFPALFVFAAQKVFHGDGLTTSAEFRRQATPWVAAYANARASILVGDEANSLQITAGPTTQTLTERQANDIKYIVEAQVGVEHTAPIGDGSWYFARAGVELQYWDNFGVSPIGLIFDESAGFAGFSVSAGIMR
jgi:hypothetical protein